MRHVIAGLLLLCGCVEPSALAATQLRGHRLFDINGTERSGDPIFNPRGSGLEHSVVDLNPSQLMFNNLGGTGPAAGPSRSIRFRNVTTFRGRAVGLTVTNLSAYKPANNEWSIFLGHMFQVECGSAHCPAQSSAAHGSHSQVAHAHSIAHGSRLDPLHERTLVKCACPTWLADQPSASV